LTKYDRKKTFINYLLKHSKEHIPNNSKIAFYRNPKECSTFYLEKTNPNHILTIHGRLKKKHRKSFNKNIKIGRIILPSLFTIFFINLSISVSTFSAMLYSFIIIDYFLFLVYKMELIKCLLGLKAVLVVEKQYNL